MTLSRSLLIPAIFIVGATFAGVQSHAQKSADNQQAADQADVSKREVVEDIVARINDQIITQSDYNRAEEQFAAEAKQQNMSLSEREAHRKTLLRDLIDQQLLLSKGKQLGITGETELVRRLDDIRKKYNLDSMEDLEKAAQAQGVSYEDFKASIRNSIITQKVVQQEVSRHVSMSEAQVRQYFKEHESEFAKPESVRLSEILIPTPAEGSNDIANSAKVEEAQKKADDIEAKLQSGADFVELAKKESGGPTAAEGGDLGEFERDNLAPVLADKAFKLQVGQFTEPVRTKQGFLILKVTGHNPGGDASYKDVETQVQEALFVQRMQPALRQYLTKLREEAYIEIKPGYTDAGASPNEIRPIYSAYIPPGPKQKKKFQRTRFRGRKKSENPKVQKAAVTTASASRKQPVAEAVNEGVQKPGKKEKIRFGQAPREALPSAATSSAESAANGSTAASTESASAQNTPVEIDAQPSEPEAEKPVKTRYGQRRVHKSKKEKAAEAEANKPPAPTPLEAETQKVQNEPLGLADQTSAKKKKKKSGEKTRYAERPKTPEKVQQPYMGPQSDTTETEPSNSQPKDSSNSSSAPAPPSDRSPQ